MTLLTEKGENHLTEMNESGSTKQEPVSENGGMLLNIIRVRGYKIGLSKRLECGPYKLRNNDGFKSSNPC